MDYVTRQFIVLTKKFRKELPKLTKLIHYDLKEHTEAIHAANKSNEQQYKIQQEWFEKVLPKKEKAKGDEATDGERHYRAPQTRAVSWGSFQLPARTPRPEVDRPTPPPRYPA